VNTILLFDLTRAGHLPNGDYRSGHGAFIHHGGERYRRGLGWARPPRHLNSDRERVPLRVASSRERLFGATSRAVRETT
jgi:hypothetical protein